MPSGFVCICVATLVLGRVHLFYVLGVVNPLCVWLFVYTCG